MARAPRKTIETQDGDIYMRFLFQETDGTKHWAMYRIADINDRKAPPIGIIQINSKHTPYYITMSGNEEL